MSRHPFIKMRYDNISFLLDKDRFLPDSSFSTVESRKIDLQDVLNSIFDIQKCGEDEMYLYYRDDVNRYDLKINTIVSVERVDLESLKPMPELLRDKLKTRGILGLNIDDKKHPTYLLDIENLLKEY